MKPLSCFLFLVTLSGFTIQATEPYYTKVAYTGSMYPRLKGGELVYINTRVPYSNLKAGDLIDWVRSDHVHVCHVLVRKVWPRYWKTKGIANAHEDREVVDKYNYVGVVVLVAK